jgi:hypothetical protein
MGSTFWAESYFRSLKASDVFNQLTTYLLQYKRVSIPSVGTILLIQHPPQLDIANKQILPPGYTAELRDGESISEHQLNFLAARLNQEKEKVRQLLAENGLWLKEKINSEGFEWKGIGLIRQPGETTAVPLTALTAVPAERVLREGATHNLLVGDQQMTSTEMTNRQAEDSKVVEKERSLFMIIGWIILLLAIFYIVFVLYQGKFRIGASGAKQSPTSFVKHGTSFVFDYRL